MTERTLALCLHDVEPVTLDRCIEIRAWLAERAVDRITMLVIPTPAGAPLDPSGCLRRLAARTGRRRRRGSPARAAPPAPRRAGRLRDWIAERQGGEAAEFVGLPSAETVAMVDTGRQILRAAGLEPRGFVAPAYAYTRTLRRELRARFDWYGALLAIHGRRLIPAPAHGLGSSTAFKRRTSPATLRTGARVPTKLLRLDVHPADFGLPGHIAALDAILRRAQRRSPATYDELVA